jgi:hypothetical protein
VLPSFTRQLKSYPLSVFEKVQAQQEKETELEHKIERLRSWEARLKEREADVSPEAAAAL